MSHPYILLFLVFLAGILIACAFHNDDGLSTGRSAVDYGTAIAISLVALCLFISGCGDTINPVRYQTVEVLVTKPCFAGRTPPAPAVELTEPTCDQGRPECIRAAKADIQELQREAKQYRRIIQECSK